MYKEKRKKKFTSKVSKKLINPQKREENWIKRDRNLPQRCHICFGKERDG